MTNASLAIQPLSHPAADLFPQMDADEFSALVQSIREHGQQEPVVMHEGAILDGRHRWRACTEIGLTPVITHWGGACGSPTAYVIAMNLNRRHLTASQKAMIGREALPHFKAEAVERKRASGRAYGKGQPKIQENVPEPIDEPTPKQSRDAAAKAVGVNPHYISDADAIATKAPDVAEQVKAGTVTIPQAKREVERREMEAVEATVERAIQSIPEAETRLAEKRLRSAYATGCHRLSEGMLMLNPEALASVWGSDDWTDFDRLTDRTIRWFEAVKAARPRGLRIVGG